MLTDHVLKFLVNIPSTIFCDVLTSHSHCVEGLDEGTMAQVRRLQYGHDVDVEAIMAETFDARQQWIKFQTPLVKTVFACFPPLKDILSTSVSGTIAMC